jgi:hypothetical protein
MTLGVSADPLLFGEDERGSDDEPPLAVRSRLPIRPGREKIIRSLLDGMILKHEARRWSAENGG